MLQCLSPLVDNKLLYDSTYKKSVVEILHLRISWKGGGVCYNNVRKAHANFFKPRPHFIETTPNFKQFLREASYSTCQSIRFWSRSLLRHAGVSHRSGFLSSSHKKGGSFSLSPVLLCTRSSPKGGSFAPPLTPLKSATENSPIFPLGLIGEMSVCNFFFQVC